MAGVSTRDIRNRIRSMESTRQITRAMEMVASSKLRQAQNRLAASRPYFEILTSTVADIAAGSRGFASPYLRSRQGDRVLYVVIAGDRGLAGGYNSNILKRCMAQMEEKAASVLPIGRKAVDYFRSHNYDILTDSYGEAADVSADDCFRIAQELSRAYLSNEFDQIRLGYTAFVSVLSQAPTAMQLLPLVRQERDAAAPMPICEPDPQAVFDAIVPEYLGGILYGALCEARCAEQAARRTAMDAATGNAGEMIAQLRLQYNRARQSAITSEIIDIVAGS